MKRLIWVLLVSSAFGQYITAGFNKGPGGGGSPTQVETFNIALPNTTNGTATATFGTNTTLGELITVVGVGISTGASLTSCTDSNSDTFTQVSLEGADATSGGGWVQIYYHKNTASGVSSVTCTESSGIGRMFVAHVKGLANNGTLDQSALGDITINSGTYSSGGTITGSSTQTCSLASFNSGCTGATATVALTGTNTIASGTALTITNGGNGGCTGVSTSATLSSGTATCSGTAVVTANAYGPVSPWNSLPITTTVANEYIVGGLIGAYNGSNCAPSASGSWTQDQHTNSLGGVGWTAAYAHQIVSSIQTNLENTGTDTSVTCQHWGVIASFD